MGPGVLLVDANVVAMDCSASSSIAELVVSLFSAAFLFIKPVTKHGK